MSSTAKWSPGLVICIGGGVLVSYILSVGPVILLFEALDLPEQAILYIYMPLVWLYDTCPPFESFLDWYLTLYGV